MPNEPPHDVTGLLGRLGRGDRAAEDELLGLVYDSLRKLAARELRGERADATLQPTALAHEAWLKLAGAHPFDWKDRAQFFAVAVAAMRRVLIDHARRRKAAKRGGERLRLAVPEDVEAPESEGIDLVDLEDALQALAGQDARQARVCELKLLGGLGVEEIAHVVGVSERTVKSDWQAGRAFLCRALFERDGT